MASLNGRMVFHNPTSTPAEGEGGGVKWEEKGEGEEGCAVSAVSPDMTNEPVPCWHQSEG